ncbi:MAG: peroxiredoxin [Bdellovibrionales bacterium]|nr:peroxiredoxin [Bdellovibrionales bacterium]
MAQPQQNPATPAPASAFVGNMAPLFTLENDDGKKVSLIDVMLQGPSMLVFYPGDFTPVCTKQLCSYQNAMERFKALGVQVIGISQNTPAQHKAFRQKYGFEFPLLTDPKRELTKVYGVTSLFMLGGTSRAVFIISKSGRILYRYVEATRLSHRNPDELMEAIIQLKNSGKLTS